MAFRSVITGYVWISKLGSENFTPGRWGQLVRLCNRLQLYKTF